tara:strand:- start:1008 stop:1907 length:900 start_codon:yes stop_codon:yes gene_type:complete
MNEDDNTTRTVKYQLSALPCKEYEIGIYDRTNDVMQLKNSTAKSIINSIKYYKYNNINGKDIFIRPLGKSPFIFIDDLSITAIAKMRENGHNLALVIESSPQNYHGWLRVAEHPLENEVASAVGRYLAHLYDGDKRSSDWRHFGRLAGFTNRKPIHVNEIGQHPFVSILEYTKGVIPAGDNLIADALHYEERKQAEIKARPQLIIDKKMSADPEAMYDEEIQRLKSIPWPDGYNASDADWSAVIKLLLNGVDEEIVSSILYKRSDSVSKRSPQRAVDYVQRTITNGFIKVSEMKSSNGG